MKFLDSVRLAKDNEKYKKEGLTKGMLGTIVGAEIRYNSFFVSFSDQRIYDKSFMCEEKNVFSLKDDILCEICIEDLELVKDNKATDEQILEELPLKNSSWWCKVENGFILNLKGERKNKIPFNYNS